MDNISRTYSSYARGDEELLTTYIVDDLHGARSDPERPLRDWSARQSYRLDRRHDEYDNVKATQSCCER